MANGISRETFDGMGVKSQLGVLFDYMKDLHKCACENRDKIDSLTRKFAQQKKFDTTVSASAGVAGGMVAMILKWVIFK
jgi:hypothetical protein